MNQGGVGGRSTIAEATILQLTGVSTSVKLFPGMEKREGGDICNLEGMRAASVSIDGVEKGHEMPNIVSANHVKLVGVV